MSDHNWIRDWDREFRREKIFILGGRAGTTLVHKCLLITVLINWGTWSLHNYSSEPEMFKHNFYNHYPYIYEEMIRPDAPFEIAKCPDFGFIVDILDRTYPYSKFIIMTRNVEDAVDSHIKTWGSYIKSAWKNYPNWERQLAENIGGYPQHIKSLLIGYTRWREMLETNALADIPDKRKLYIKFEDLMELFGHSMQKIAKFIDIPYEVYINLWTRLRKIKLMHTASDVTKYIQ